MNQASRRGVDESFSSIATLLLDYDTVYLRNFVDQHKWNFCVPQVSLVQLDIKMSFHLTNNKKALLKSSVLDYNSIFFYFTTRKTFFRLCCSFRKLKNYLPSIYEMELSILFLKIKIKNQTTILVEYLLIQKY